MSVAIVFSNVQPSNHQASYTLHFGGFERDAIGSGDADYHKVHSASFQALWRTMFADRVLPSRHAVPSHIGDGFQSLDCWE